MAKNVSIEILSLLREQLLDGSFPLKRINEPEIAAHFGVSRTPVRAALHILAAEGLLDYRPNAGFTIREATPEFVKGVYQVRGVIEGLASSLAAEQGLSPEALDELEGILNESDQLIAVGPETPRFRDRLYDLNDAFHQCVFTAARSEYLALSLHRSRSIPQINRIKSVAFNADFLILAHNDHHFIFEAIRNGESARADYLSREHVRRGSNHILAQMRSGVSIPDLPPLDLTSFPGGTLPRR